MNHDFHYGVIKVLARAAGFSEDDAQTIAYASQYTDDSANHQPVLMENLGNLSLNKKLEQWVELLGLHNGPERKIVVKVWEGTLFDPVCTSHVGVDYILGLDSGVQRKVYVSFHFLPGKKHFDGQEFSYLTIPNGGIASSLLDAIVDAYRTDDHNQKKLRSVALCALGIALHSYADTWAHQSFSGRRSSADNDLIDLKVDGVKPPIDEIMKLGALVPIGHLDAGNYPDRPDNAVEFEFKRGENLKRSNTDAFLEAAEKILSALAPLNGKDPAIEWGKIGATLKDCLAEESDAKDRVKLIENEFKKEFPELTMDYDKGRWEREAVKMKPAVDFKYSITFLPTGQSNKWFDFHVAALAQRTFVRGKIES